MHLDRLKGRIGAHDGDGRAARVLEDAHGGIGEADARIGILDDNRGQRRRHQQRAGVGLDRLRVKDRVPVTFVSSIKAPGWSRGTGREEGERAAGGPVIHVRFRRAVRRRVVDRGRAIRIVDPLHTDQHGVRDAIEHDAGRLQKVLIAETKEMPVLVFKIVRVAVGRATSTAPPWRW